MELFGIGIPELLFIGLIALVVLGPKDMQKAGYTIAAWLRKVALSDGWRFIKDTARELRYLPNRLMREASMDFQRNAGEMHITMGGEDRSAILAGPAKEGITIPTPGDPLAARHLGKKDIPPSAGDQLESDQGENA